MVSLVSPGKIAQRIVTKLESLPLEAGSCSVLSGDRRSACLAVQGVSVSAGNRGLEPALGVVQARTGSAVASPPPLPQGLGPRGLLEAPHQSEKQTNGPRGAGGPVRNRRARRAGRCADSTAGPRLRRVSVGHIRDRIPSSQETSGFTPKACSCWMGPPATEDVGCAQTPHPRTPLQQHLGRCWPDSWAP